MPASAILFPGQGSQTPDMAEMVREVRPDLLERVTSLVGHDPFSRAAESTDFAQPAIFCASLAGWQRLGRPNGEMMAGHSLGELGALAAAGALTEDSALKLVVLRGQLMSQAREGGMVALIGAGAVEHAPELAERHGLALANDNSPQQVVLSGERELLAPAVASAKELGLRALELPVSGAFHSPLMAPIVPRFREALSRTEVLEPAVPVFSAVTAAPFDDVRRRLVQALTMPVRWRETLEAMRARGAERFVEVGPGRVLLGLAKRTLSDVELVGA